MSANLDSNQESAAAENLLYQRLIIFLIVFSVLVIGAVNTQRKILFLSVLTLGVIICWVLTFILIRTARRIDNKSGGRIVRLVLGYFVPVFCSTLLTIALLFGSTGFADPYLFNLDVKPVQVENKINEIRKDIADKISPDVKKSPDAFKSVDSVIAEGKVIRSGKKTEDQNIVYPSSKAVSKKQIAGSKYFKSVDSVIAESKVIRSGKKTDDLNYVAPGVKGPSKKQVEDSKYFKSLDSTIVTDKTGKRKGQPEIEKYMPVKKDTVKKIQDNKNFSDIEKVIQKGK